MRPRLEALGFACTLHDNPGPSGGPLVVGEPIEGPGLETVLIHGDGDVIRARTESWRDGLHPFRLVEE